MIVGIFGCVPAPPKPNILPATPSAAGPHSREEGCVVLSVLDMVYWLLVILECVLIIIFQRFIILVYKLYSRPLLNRMQCTYKFFESCLNEC